MRKIILIFLILAFTVIPATGATKKGKDAKATTQEEKAHNDFVKAKGLDVSNPCLKHDKQKTRKQNAEDIKACIDSLPDKK